MSVSLFILLSLCIYLGLRFFARQKFLKKGSVTSLPTYYGWYGVLWLAVPAALLSCLNFLPHKTFGLSWPWLLGLSSLLACWMGWRGVEKQVHARRAIEKACTWGMWGLTLMALCIIASILSILLVKAWAFFEQVPLLHFIAGLHWQPSSAQDSLSESFGAAPLFWGTCVITIFALCIAIPLGLLSAIYLSTYANPTIRHTFRPLLETMAGIPTVVYGFFAAIFVAPLLQKTAHHLGWAASSQSALAAGVVLGLMLIPMLTALCDDVLRAVPASLKEGALGLGATRAEAMLYVILPAAKSGLVSAVLLTLSRAIGETMLVVMAAGLVANLTLNPFASVTTVTVQIVSLLTGDQQVDSPETLAAYALGLTLFLVTLFINFLAERIQKKAIKL